MQPALYRSSYSMPLPRNRPAQACTSPRFCSMNALRRVLSDTIAMTAFLYYVASPLAARRLVRVTRVPRAGAEDTRTPSIKLCITAKPRPERSSGLPVV